MKYNASSLDAFQVTQDRLQGYWRWKDDAPQINKRQHHTRVSLVVQAFENAGLSVSSGWIKLLAGSGLRPRLPTKSFRAAEYFNVRFGGTALAAIQSF